MQNVKQAVRAVVIGEAVSALPKRRGLVAAMAWHRQRIEALSAQLDRTAVRRDPRRSCDIALSREHHETMLGMLKANLSRTPRPTPPMLPTAAAEARRTANNDRRMSGDWVSQLEGVRSALVA